MTIFRSALWLRPISLGVLFAAVGFSFAVATPASREAGSRDSNQLTVNCARSQVQFVTTTDLGIFVVGTQFNRQIVVEFGFKPHHFLFGSQTVRGITISDSGMLTGALTKAEQDVIEVRVKDDSSGTITQPSISQFFTLEGMDFDLNLPLEFAIDPTPNLKTEPAPIPLPGGPAVAHETYAYTLQGNGGSPPYTFQLTTLDGFPKGLALAPDTGLILGVPIAPTLAPNDPAVFTIALTDSVGRQVIRKFSLKILPGTISSSFVATAGNFKLKFGTEPTAKNSHDALQLTIILNKTNLNSAGIRTVDDLKGVDFDMFFGGAELPNSRTSTTTATGTTTSGTSTSNLPTKFDAKGMLQFPNRFGGAQPIPGLTTAYKVKLDPKTGMLKVKFTDVKLIDGIGAQFT